MSRDLARFEFPQTGQAVRTTDIDGEPCILVADVCTILAHSNPAKAVADHVDPEDVRRATLTIREGSRMVQRERAFVTESGLYALIFGSRLPAAKAFKRWVTAEVLPAIRRTGSYSVAHQLPTSFAEALELAARQARELEAAESHIAEITPAAESWNVLAAADGDYAVADAAKVLSRDPAIQIGRDRLFNKLGELGWAFRQRGDQKWRADQKRAIDTGRLSELPQPYYHPRTGQLVLDAPQLRVTSKGLGELHHLLGGSAPLPSTSTTEGQS